MRVKAGKTIQPFEALDIQGRMVRLQDYAGQWVLLEFLRFVTCPRCSLRLYSLSLRYPQWQAAGLQVIAFVESPAALIQERTYAREAPFPIIADPGQEFYRRYGVKNSRWGLFIGGRWHHKEIEEAARLGFGQPEVVGNDYRMPADLIIDPKQVVRLAHYGRHSGDALPLAEIEKALQVEEKERSVARR